jgi:23S rRNA pseudouridine1911/1915/1917 synthase
MLSIVYEDSDFLVVNKPAGIAVHKTRPNDPQHTVVDELLAHNPAIATAGEDSLRPGIVHRLDKETSGLMVVAKTNTAFFHLKEQFKNRTVSKIYVALVHGKPKTPQGTITAPLGKIGTKQTTQIKGKRELDERDAITDYRTLKNYRDFTLLEVTPHTGRTHQIRVHLKSIGCPIAGDTLYGPQKLSNPPGLTRLFLHAQRLSFVTSNGSALSFETDLPDELTRVVENLRGT